MRKPVKGNFPAKAGHGLRTGRRNASCSIFLLLETKKVTRGKNKNKIEQ
jgi:hypothetical protein